MRGTGPIPKLSVKPQASKPQRGSGRSTINREKIFLSQDKPKPKRSKLTKWQVLSLFRRIVGVAAACMYIYISMMATWRMTGVLRAMPNPTRSFNVFTASLIGDYVGHDLLRDSPLVLDILHGDTSRRDYALFLESGTKTSTEKCSEVPQFDSTIYNFGFLTTAYMEMVHDTSYHTSVLAELELVVVIVDCSFTPLINGDPSTVRVFYVVRSRRDPSDLYLVLLSLSVQDYEIRAHNKYGPALFGMLQVFQDMDESSKEEFYLVAPTYPFQRSLEFQIYEFVRITDESYLELRSVPREPLFQPVQNLVTTRKRGFYNGDTQSNINYMYSTLNKDENATSVFSRWEWVGEPVMTDAWAWVHGLHFIFGLQAISSLIVLSLVAYQNYRAGKIWIGDPFASLSTWCLVTRAALVLLAWYVHSFWSAFQLGLANAALVSGRETVYIHKEIVYADVLVVYLGLVALLSAAIRERIDPGFAIFLFEMQHIYRASILRSSAGVYEKMVSYIDNLFLLGDEVATATMSPLHFYSAFQIPEKDSMFLIVSFYPRLVLMVVITGYAMLRKLYRLYYPDELSPRSTLSSGTEKSAPTLKGSLTNFEISTGAELETRFGMISDYKNYVYLKGMKFASADGVYCSGYVIVNGKCLVAVKDLLAIGTMKLVRARFTNVHAYEVDGNTVKDTARLVSPTTFTWGDLWHLNVAVLL